MRTTPCLLALLLASCGPSASSVDAGGDILDLPDAASDLAPQHDPGVGADGDVASTPDDGFETTPPDTPILDRPARPAMACTVKHDALKLADQHWWGADVAATPGGFLALRGEMPASTIGVMVSAIGLDGTLSGAKTLETSGALQVINAVMLPRADGVVASWLGGPGGQTVVRWIKTDNAGETLAGPRDVAGTGGAGLFAMAPAGDGVAVLFGSQGYSPTLLRFQRLDADGQVAGAAVTVATGSAALSNVVMVPFQGGFAAAWRASDTASDEVRVARLDPDGNRVGDVQVFAAPGRVPAEPALLAHGDGLLLAWSEAQWPADYSGSDPYWTAIRVQPLDLQARPVGPPQWLSAPVNAVTAHTPRWIDLGETVGLAFSQGKMILICAGCVPDDRIGFVPLHPDDLVPAGEVAWVQTTAGGGLENARLARAGADVLLYSDITYHALALPSAAWLSCVPAP